MSTPASDPSFAWSPFDCLAVAATTESGLLRLSAAATEVELLVLSGVELRALGGGGGDGGPAEPMVPLLPQTTSDDDDDDNKTNSTGAAVDSSKRAADWVDRAENLQVTVTTHRLVFFREKVPRLPRDSSSTNNNNNNNDSTTTTREARYLHLSNIFQMEAVTVYFRSPKIVLSTAVGDLALAFPKSAAKQRDDCQQQLHLSLQRKQWDVDDEAKRRERLLRKMNQTSRRVGVDAVLSASHTRRRQAAALTDAAFGGDAETLLKEATELVQIIHKYVATLDRESSSSSSSDPNHPGGGGGGSAADTDRLVTLLQDMGMTSALKKADYKGAEAAYYDQTARQLADFLRPKLVTVPVMTLTDVYCLFNRARGTHLLSPEDLLLAVEHLERLHLGLSVVTFPHSGLKVLQDDRRANEAVLAETFLRLCAASASGSSAGFVTAAAVSRHCHVSAVLAAEQLRAAERAEFLVRDETVEAVRFYPNLFREWSAK